MKKIFAVALSFAAVMTAGAQNDAKSLYEAGKKAEGEFNKSIMQAQLTGQMDPGTAYTLIDSYKLYMQALPLDSMPDEKGKIKPKHSKKILSSIEKHMIENHYQNAAIFLYNANHRYPQAYEAFMLAGTLPRDAKFTEKGVLFHDTICAENLYNAGLCAYSAKEFDKSAEAFSMARKLNYPSKDAHTYEIASLQALESEANHNNDSITAAKYADAVHLCAADGVKKFGSDDVYIFNNYINKYFLSDDYKTARELINAEIAKNPTNANLYNVRAKTFNNEEDFESALADFIKSSELSSMFITLEENAKEVNKIGKIFLGNVSMNDKEGKLAIKTKCFDTAMKIAEKAKSFAKDENETGRIDYLVEDIIYNIENCEK